MNFHRYLAALAAALLLALVHLSIGQTSAQEKQGPLTPPPKREVIRIPVETAAEPPPIPIEEIVRRFTEKEEELLRARSSFTFRKTVRVQEIGEDGKAAGEFQVITEPAVASDGSRYEKVVDQSPSTLRRLRLAPEDLETVARIPLFALIPGNLGKYDLSYAGKQPVDELSTYVFRVKPKALERTRAYFEGLVWVDDRDLVVVKTYGKWVTETGDVTSPEFPFTFFETYREIVGGNQRFPTYARSDDALKVKDGELRIRLTIRWTDYKPLGPAAAAPAPAKNPQ